MASRIELLADALERGSLVGADVPAILGDPKRIEQLRATITRLTAEDVVVEMVGDQDFRRERQGLDGFLEAWRDWVEPFESFRIEIEDVIEAGPHVVTLVRQTGRPRGVDTEIENDSAAVWTFEGDRVVRVEFHLQRETAMRAAGLEPG